VMKIKTCCLIESLHGRRLLNGFRNAFSDGVHSFATAENFKPSFSKEVALDRWCGRPAQCGIYIP